MRSVHFLTVPFFGRNGESMATLLSARGMTRAFGDEVLFSDVNFDVMEKEKIGFVGVNGSGKTTLFRLLAGLDTPDGGSIIRNKELRLGYMEQHTNMDPNASVYQEVRSVFAPLLEMEAEIAAINHRLETGEGDLESLIQKQHQLQETYEAKGGLLYESRTRAMLLGLGFSEEEFARKTGVLSGGEKTRVQLAKMLLSGANLILLDEPTNHLDISSVAWLESFLQSFDGSMIVISHDRYFLDKVTNRTMELENKTLHSYTGNYSTYLEKKEKSREAENHHYINTMREIKRIEGIIKQQRQWNRERNIKTAEHKQKAVDRLKASLVVPEKLPEGIGFSFEVEHRGGNEVLRVENLAKGFGGTPLFSHLNLEVMRGERVFLMGDNGSGKTTLLKILTGAYPPDAGEVAFGSQIDVAYYDQHQESLDHTKSVLDEVWDAYPKMTRTEIMNALAAFHFKGEETEKIIGSLSGGERSRVSLLKLMLSRANFLLLDEPTNHLDIQSREALEDALLEYEGTAFIVSHDRYFVNRMADRVYYLDDNGLTEYLGNYDYVVEKRKEAPTVVKEEKTAAKNDYQKNKELAAKKRKVENAIKRIEETIAKRETLIAQKEAELQNPEIASSYTKLTAIGEEIEAEKAALAENYESWEALQEEWSEWE